VSTERIVVVSALNIIHEYLQYQQQQENDRLMFGDEIGEMEKKIKLALSEIK